VGVFLSTPVILWAGIASLLVWDAEYFDNMCEGVYGKLDNKKEL
jgi:hypothetical protein